MHHVLQCTRDAIIIIIQLCPVNGSLGRRAFGFPAASPAVMTYTPVGISARASRHTIKIL